MVDPPVKFKTVKGHALATDANFSNQGPHLGVEAVAIHAEVTRGIAETEEPQGDNRWFIRFEVHARLGISDQDKPLSRPPFHARVHG